MQYAVPLARMGEVLTRLQALGGRDSVHDTGRDPIEGASAGRDSIDGGDAGGGLDATDGHDRTGDGRDDIPGVEGRDAARRVFDDRRDDKRDELRFMLRGRKVEVKFLGGREGSTLLGPNAGGDVAAFNVFWQVGGWGSAAEGRGIERAR